MNRYYSCPWAFVLTLVGRVRSLFDRLQTTDIAVVYVAILHGSLAQEPSVLINTTVQEKNITYPTDAKLAIKIINRLNNRLYGSTSFTQFALFIVLITIVSFKCLLREDNFCTQYLFCTNITSFAYCLFNGLVLISIAILA
jgi:hypothetical protein